MKKLLEKLKILNSEIIDRSEYCCLNKGYDNEALIKQLWADYKIKPVIDIRKYVKR